MQSKWTARCFITCEAPTVLLTYFKIQFEFLFVVLYLLSPCMPRQNHTDRCCSSPPHGPQSSMPVPQCQANKSVESDNLSKALTQFKDKGSQGLHCRLNQPQHSLNVRLKMLGQQRMKWKRLLSVQVIFFVVAPERLYLVMILSVKTWAVYLS